MSAPILPNRDARRLFLARHGLLAPPRTQPLGGLLDALGFVQVDSVLTLARAHDLILWSRSPGYRPADLQRLVKGRAAFEHWTHDASVIPMAAWPHWRHRFARDRARMDGRWDRWQGPDFREAVLFHHDLGEKTSSVVDRNGKALPSFDLVEMTTPTPVGTSTNAQYSSPNANAMARTP